MFLHQNNAFFFSNSAFRNTINTHKPSDFLGVPPTDDDVMVADGMLQQIRLQVDIERNLRAAEMVAVRRLDGLRLRDEITV